MYDNDLMYTMLSDVSVCQDNTINNSVILCVVNIFHSFKNELINQLLKFRYSNSATSRKS